jgi:hypothetical protein
MPHPAHPGLSQQFWWPVIPETCPPPGEGMVWLLSAALGDVAALGGRRAGRGFRRLPAQDRGS